MKTLIQIVVVALLFGGLAAGGSIYLQRQLAQGATESASEKPAGDEHPPTETTATDQTVDEHAAKPDAEKDNSGHDDKESGDTHDATGHDTDGKPAVPIEEELAVAEPRKSLDAPGPDDHDQSAHAAEIPVEAPVAVRPPYAPEGDEAGALINLLRQRSRIASETEKQLAERQEAMQLIFEDLRSEQARTLKIRQRLALELKESQHAIDMALLGIETDRAAMQRELSQAKQASDDAVRAAIAERDSLQKQLTDAKSPNKNDGSGAIDPGAPEDNANLKKMAAVFDGMPAENVAKVFEQLVKNKRINAVVSLINAMKDRNAAKVLGVISDTNPELAADLTDRVKRLKESTAKPTTE